MRKAIFLGVAAALVSTVALAQAGHHGGRMKTVDADGDGAVTAAESQAATAKRFDRMDANHDGAVSAAEMAGKRFARLDGNNDGRITREEMAAKSNERFARVDANKDGKIDANERAAMRAQWKAKRGG